MDVVLDAPRSQPLLPASLCPAEVDVCGGREHGRPLLCEDLLVVSGCRECGGGDSVSHERDRVCCCQEARQEDLQGELERALFQDTERTWKYELLKQTSQSVAKHILQQSNRTERQMKQEFEQLRRFLREEEEARIAAVREEEERKRRKAKEESKTMGQLMQALADTIRDIEAELERDDVSFLQSYEKTIKRTWKDLQNPRKEYDSLINVPKHVGNLRFRVWEKMQNICPYTPVTLDPNSASCSLSVSDSLDAVCSSSISSSHPTHAHQRPLLPPAVPERFHPYAAALGSEGVSSGLHQWDVEVGDSSNWTLGACYASVRRWAEFEACPEEGLWTLSLRDGVLLAMMSPCEAVVVPPSPTPDEGRRRQQPPLPRVVRVSVDWDAGRVSFSDAERHTHLFTFTHTFTEPLHPYFETICKGHPLVVLPQGVRVMVEELQPPD